MADETQINVVSFSMPDKVSLSEKYSINLTLKNIGGKKGYQSFRLRKNHPDDTSKRMQDLQFNITLEPGETRELDLSREAAEIGVSHFDWQKKVPGINNPRYGWRETTSEINETVNVTVPNLSIGETFVTSWDLAYTVKKAELIPYFEYRSNGQIEKKRPSGFSGQFAALTLKLENLGNEAIDPVISDRFYVLYNDTRHQGYRFPPNTLNYTQTPLQPKLEPGETMIMHKKFTVPYDTEKKDITVRWMLEYDSDPGYENPNQLKKVNWRP